MSDECPSTNVTEGGTSHVRKVGPSGPVCPRGYTASEGGGGSTFDAFLLACSQEVGQVILTLPNVFSRTGIGAGVVLQLIFATCALYTNFLLVSLHAEYRTRLAETNDPKHKDPYHIVSYHEILGEMVGPWLRKIGVIMVFCSLLGLTVVQIIATSSNMYIFSDALNKRDYAIICGFLFSLVAFIPTFRSYRFMAIIAIITASYTAWFMTISSELIGPQETTTWSAPRSSLDFFNGAVQLLFVYGGHASNIEVADVMDNPAIYDRGYFWSYLYVFTITMPNAVAGYHTFGDKAWYNANSFALFPRSIYRDVGVITMCIQNCVAFGLFIGPLFHIWEKAIHVHDKAFSIRVMCRLPLCAIIATIACAFPFFGAINSIIGAFTTSFGTYLLPALAYNLAFSSSSKYTELNMVKPPPVGLDVMRRLNWMLIIFVSVLGVGLGGYSSVKNFLLQIDNFDYFAACYQCYPPEENPE